MTIEHANSENDAARCSVSPGSGFPNTLTEQRDSKRKWSAGNLIKKHYIMTLILHAVM